MTTETTEATQETQVTEYTDKRSDTVEEYPQFNELFKIFTPPPIHDINSYSEEYISLPVESSFDSGKLTLHPYQKLIQGAITDPAIKEVVLMTSAQIGKSLMLSNISFYYTDIEPSPVLIAQPNFELCKAYSKDRLSPTIRDSERLTEVFGDQSGRGDSTLLRKQGNTGGIISFASFNSPSSLASKSIRVVLADEVDRIEVLNSSEGNILKMLGERTSSFPNSKFIKVSTPKKIEHSHIYKEYLLSDQGALQVACIHCDEYFDLLWETVHWDKDVKGEFIVGTEKIVCTQCGGIHMESDRLELLQRQQYRIQNPISKIKGFHVNILVNPTKKLQGLVEEFIEAKGDPSLMETFVTLKLGKPFEDIHEQVSIADYDGRMSNFGMYDLPEDILYITGSADVQKDRVEASTFGYGLSGQLYFLEHKVFDMDTSVREEYRNLFEWLKTFEYLTEGGVRMKPSSWGIDSGYQTKLIYDFAKVCRNTKDGIRVYPLKGSGNPTTPIAPLHQKKRKGSFHYMTGNFQSKELIYQRLRITDPKHSGFVNFSSETTTDDILQQIHSERKVTEVKGNKVQERYVLINQSVRNEVLDTFCYSLATESIDRPNYKYLARVRRKAITEDECIANAKLREDQAEEALGGTNLVKDIDQAIEENNQPINLIQEDNNNVNPARYQAT